MRATMRDRWSTNNKGVQRIRAAAGIIAIGWALWPLVVVLFVAFRRLNFPFDLEWCEGGSLYQAYRLLHGLPLYERSDPSWAPFPYPPAHTMLLALLGTIHLDFWMGRLASIVLFSLMCWVLFRQVYEHSTAKFYAALTGAFGISVVACAYPYTGQWYDLVRVDSMMMFLCVWGTSRVIKPRMTKLNILTTAAIFAAAVFTKQTAVFFVAWAGIFATIYRPRFGLALSGVTLTMCLLLLAVAQWITHGGFWFWVVTNLARQQINHARLVAGIDIVLHFSPFVVALPLVALLLLVARALSARSALWIGSLLFAIPASLLPFAKSGGYLNNLMPILVLLGPVTMLLATDISNIRWAIPGNVVRVVTIIAMITFVALHKLHYQRYLPDTKNRQAAANLNKLVQSLPGGVVSPYFAFLPARNGHANHHWHRMVVLDAYYRGESMSESDALENSGARWVLLHSAEKGLLAWYLEHHFSPPRELPSEFQAHTVTGERASLNELWEKK